MLAERGKEQWPEHISNQKEGYWKDELLFAGDVEIGSDVIDGVAGQRGSQRTIYDCRDASE